MREFEPAQQKHLRQIPQTELVPQPAEYDLEDDIRGQLEVVEWSARPLIELPTTRPAPKDGVTEIGRAVQVPDSGRLAMRADHEQRVGAS